MLEAGNRHFLIAQAHGEQDYVCYHFWFLLYSRKFENFKILPIKLLMAQNVKFHVLWSYTKNKLYH
jgi:hypothetical protein